MKDNIGYARHQRGGLKFLFKNQILLIKIAEAIISGDAYLEKPDVELFKEIDSLPEPVKCAGAEGIICYLKLFDIHLKPA